MKPALKQATVNSLLALAVLIDLRLGSVTRFFEEEWLVLWYIECTLGALLCCNALVYIASYMWTHFWEQPVPITPKQMKLFRISEKVQALVPMQACPLVPGCTTQDQMLPLTRVAFQIGLQNLHSEEPQVAYTGGVPHLK